MLGMNFKETCGNIHRIKSRPTNEGQQIYFDSLEMDCVMGANESLVLMIIHYTATL